MKRTIQFLTALVFLAAAQQSAVAQDVIGIIKFDKSPVRIEPDTQSEILVELGQGKRVTIVEKAGAWLKIKVALDSSFTFKGYIPEKWIIIPPGTKIPNAQPRQSLKPNQSPPPITRQPNFQAIPTPIPQTATRMDPSPAISELRPRSAPLPGVNHDNAETKTFLEVNVGYILYHYALNTGGVVPGQIFAYNLPGLGVSLSYKRWLKELDSWRVRLGVSAQYQHGLYQSKTSLADSSNVNFSSVSSKSSSNDFIARGLSEYRFSNAADSIVLGASLGIQYFRFNGDDVQSNSGPILLYVTQQTIAPLLGLVGTFPVPLLRKLTASLGVDLLLFSFASESPGSTTGTSPSAGIGFIPSLSLAWAMAPQHKVSTGYKVRVQNYSFKGAGTRVAADVTDGRAETAAHTFLLGYEYSF